MTVAMKAAQLGVTECGVNRALYTLDVLKRHALYVLPTTLSSGDFSKARFDGSLSLSPYLKAMFTDNNAVALKRTAVNSLYIRANKGESNLLSVPVSCLILDEVDRIVRRPFRWPWNACPARSKNTSWQFRRRLSRISA